MYARHEAMLNARTEDGATLRAYLEASAERGNAESRKRLDGPEFPEGMEYLWRWTMELHGRSGVGLGGLLPLSYTTIRHWSELTGQYPDPMEVDALVALDAALRSTEPVESDEPAEPAPIVWPDKKEAHG